MSPTPWASWGCSSGWRLVVCVGGSLAPIGGHNPVEPAQFGCAVIYGPRMTNFSEVAPSWKPAPPPCGIADGAELSLGGRTAADRWRRRIPVGSRRRPRRGGAKPLVVDAVLDALAADLGRCRDSGLPMKAPAFWYAQPGNAARLLSPAGSLFAALGHAQIGVDTSGASRGSGDLRRQSGSRRRRQDPRGAGGGRSAPKPPASIS